MIYSKEVNFILNAKYNNTKSFATSLSNFIKSLSVFPMEINSGCNRSLMKYQRTVNIIFTLSQLIRFLDKQVVIRCNLRLQPEYYIMNACNRSLQPKNYRAENTPL